MTGLEKMIVGLVVSVLDKELKDLVVMSSEEDVVNWIKGEDEAEVVWIKPEIGESVHCFWRLVKEKKVVDGAYIIFTGVDGTLPCWADLSNFEGGKFAPK